MTDATDRFRVVVAGGGVAALEAVLALRAIAGERVEIELVAPTETFGLRALSVAMPFGADAPRKIELESFCRDNQVAYRKDAIAEIWSGSRHVLTAAGDEIGYDALLLAFGTTQRDALPGARSFRGAHDADWFADLLGRIETGSVRRLLFAVPEEVRWSLPLYELALLTAQRMVGAARPWLELAFVTHESSPLAVFGEAASNRISGLMAAAGIALETGMVPVSFDGEVLHCEDGHGFATRHVITLPALSVTSMPGLPQGRHGFIGCDPEMRVEGLSAVWAAGDATWFPIKQGGLAAQQAEVAASGIAAAAGALASPSSFAPVVRGTLLTGGEPQFLREDTAGGGASDVSTSPLWWPPVKVAGPRLAPYLWREWSDAPGGPAGPLEDLDAGSGDARAMAEADHRDAVALALTFADVDARDGDLGDALRWLQIAEGLNVTLPDPYVELRRRWQEQLAAEGKDEMA